MKTVLITGANRGLGKELAHVFDQAGWQLILNSRTPKVNGLFKNAICVFGDLRDNVTVVQLAQTAIENNVDVVINNAGVYHSDDLDNMTMGSIKEVFNINFFAHVNLTKRLWSFLKGKNGGLIVNINSLAGNTGSPKEMAYTASKHALKGFFESLQFEATKYSIRILNIFAGAIDTKMAGNRKDNTKFMKPSEVALSIFLLCTEYDSLRITNVELNRRIYD